MAEFLVRRRASANDISLAGLAAALLGGLAFAGTREWPMAASPLWLGGAVLVQIRLLANLLDGMVAIGRGVASPTGELFNEVPDRLSDSAILMSVGWAAGNLSLGLFAALAAMATAYVRALGRGLQLASDFSGPMAKQQRMAVITALAVWCGCAPSSWSAGVPGDALWLIALLSLWTAGRRLWRIGRALRG